MEVDGFAQVRPVLLLVFIAALSIWAAGVASGRRRQARFAVLAQSFGSHVERDGEFLSRFPVEVGGRTFDVRCQHIGKGIGVGGWCSPGWYVVTEVPLQGVSALHSAEIQPRTRRSRVIDPRDSDFGKYFTVRDAGFSPSRRICHSPANGASGAGGLAPAAERRSLDGCGERVRMNWR